MRFSILSRLIRLPNLLLSALSLLLIYIIATQEFLDIVNGRTYLILALEILTVLIIMAGGNIYNDFIDQETDRINRPESLVVGNMISPKQAYFYYVFSLIISALLSVSISYLTGNLWILLYHILAIFLLYYYSRVAKGTPWVGNLIVALLCALIFPAVPLLFTHSLPAGWWHPDHKMAKIVFLFSAFSFLTTLWRELVKDVEDQLGDERAGHFTLPVLWSVSQVKYLGSTFSIILLILLLNTSIIFFLQGKFLIFSYGVGLVISLLYLYFLFIRANTKLEHHRLSHWLKLFMLQGLLLLVLLGL